jgi:hypothetical protein
MPWKGGRARAEATVRSRAGLFPSVLLHDSDHRARFRTKCLCIPHAEGYYAFLANAMPP